MERHGEVSFSRRFPGETSAPRGESGQAKGDPWGRVIPTSAMGGGDTSLENM